MDEKHTYRPQESLEYFLDKIGCVEAVDFDFFKGVHFSKSLVDLNLVHLG